ncbi:MAG: Colicin-E3 [Verrucomicrobia bacterium ADurb.Bin118]|jgi:hypothetical protein|nr:hypothetical protein [Verrucomicrobiota bacterium]OQB88700.1 MAG: Colicin-E3 [Verrucomicrobia bacterium ADurb.Bin118]
MGHANAGLYYYGYRFYEPNLQRWLNQDPLEEFGGLNLHQFVFNDPINLTDKDGRIPPLPIVGAIIYFSCTAIVNAPGPDDETFPPYHDAPDPVTVYCACLFPGATVGFNLGETIAEDLGVPAEVVTAAGMMIPAPKIPRGFPNLSRAKPKTSVQGGGGLRKRWKDKKGNIYEWDYQHGTVEKYNKRGKHLGEFDGNTGAQLKPADSTKCVEP